MKQEQLNKKIKAFSLFEVTVALAILSILLTIVTVALNRFNEQVKLSSDVHQELNQFYIVRFNLWRELYESDSLFCRDNEALIYKNGEAITYYIEDEQLFRKKEGTTTDLKIAAESISEIEEGKNQKVVFAFLWKNEIMKLSYLKLADLESKINRYFENLK